MHREGEVGKGADERAGAMLGKLCGEVSAGAETCHSLIVSIFHCTYCLDVDIKPNSSNATFCCEFQYQMIKNSSKQYPEQKQRKMLNDDPNIPLCPQYILLTMSEIIKRQKLLITNKKREYSRAESFQDQQISLPVIQRQYDNVKAERQEFQERLRKLQGNIKMLQKKYRQNLKQGFQNKIKAYRLQAVFQRKMLKNAIKEIQQQKESSQIKKKWSGSADKNKLFNSRIEAMKIERYQRKQQFRENIKRERASFSICLHQNRNQMQAIAKKSHDRILEEEQNVNKKKDYFTFLRKSTKKKQEQLEKQDLLERIFHNSEKLKLAKQTLTILKYNNQQQGRDKTFLTI